LHTRRSTPNAARWQALRARAKRRPKQAYDSRLQQVLDTCPGYNLGKAYKKVTRVFEQEFRESELTLPQFAVLVNTGVTEIASASEIADRLGSDLSTISRTMELVVKRGLVEQRRGEDRRVRMYSLTPEGRRVLDDALVQWERAKRRVLREIRNENWDQTLTTLRHISSSPATDNVAGA